MTAPNRIPSSRRSVTGSGRPSRTSAVTRLRSRSGFDVARMWSRALAMDLCGMGSVVWSTAPWRHREGRPVEVEQD